MFDNYSVRLNAREKLRGNWWYAFLIALVYSLIAGAVNFSSNNNSVGNAGIEPLIDFGAAAALIGIVGFVATILLSGPMEFGFSYVWLSFNRGNPLEIGHLFYGFRGPVFGKAILLWFMRSLFILLWTLLFIIPGLIKSISYSMAYYIQIDNPEYGWNDCIKQSMDITSGFKLQLFVLSLSFIGWALLSILTLGFGFFFLIPYMQVSMADFYERIKNRSDTYQQDSGYTYQP